MCKLSKPAGLKILVVNQRVALVDEIVTFILAY